MWFPLTGTLNTSGGCRAGMELIPKRRFFGVGWGNRMQGIDTKPGCEEARGSQTQQQGLVLPRSVASGVIR